MENHNLNALDYLRQYSPDLETLLDYYADQYDTGDPDDCGSPAAARSLAVGIIDELIAQLQQFREELEKADLKEF